ncbi:MAG: exopolyphosphatase [Gammaproteobacteria bacterium]|jgi:exopolyphosphatase / guanosine-5'-triphosphate,3'-diphosphate pyrophosphatase
MNTEQQNGEKHENSGPDTVAAIDLGSNSFHMIVARLDEAGTLSVIDRLREPVRLGGGLTSKGNLSKEARERALECLARFGERIRGLPRGSVRIVGTNTLRLAKNAEKFVRKGEELLGHPIEIIAGREEARLIYLGVAHGRQAREGNRLVVDIGGGSTELIIGEGLDSKRRESLQAGCVSATNAHFRDGSITEKRMRKAVMDAELAIYPLAHRFTADKWNEAIGCSGTIKAIRDIVQAEGWSETGITLESLYRLRDALVKAGHCDNIKLETLSPDRRPVIAGGLAVLIAVFETLAIDLMRVSELSLREGLLYDLVGRLRDIDIRDASVESAAMRWSIDRQQADKVTKTALEFFEQVKGAWKFDRRNRNVLKWSAQLHEIGLQVSHNQYHKHGGYILTHADLAGFSRTEQALLSRIVLCHRRKFRPEIFEDLASQAVKPGMRMCILLRLAALLHRGRTDESLPDIAISAIGNHIRLGFPAGWLEQHTLTRGDLKEERKYLSKAGFQLEFA